MPEIKTINGNANTQSTEVIWENGFSREACIDVPIVDYHLCISASGAVRIIIKDGVYRFEMELFGVRKDWELIDQCIDGYTIGIASLKACITNVRFDGQKLKSVRVLARLCAGQKFGPRKLPLGVEVPAVNLEQCWDVVGVDIPFFVVPDMQLMAAADRDTRLDAVIASARMRGKKVAAVELPIQAV